MYSSSTASPLTRMRSAVAVFLHYNVSLRWFLHINDYGAIFTLRAGALLLTH